MGSQSNGTLFVILLIGLFIIFNVGIISPPEPSPSPSPTPTPTPTWTPNPTPTPTWTPSPTPTPTPTEGVRLNPQPWIGWYEWHSSSYAYSSFPLWSYSTLTASDYSGSLKLAITKQDLSLPLKDKDLWLRFTVAVKSVDNANNWLRAAIVPRIDPNGQISSTLDRYTEFDFYQGPNTHPNSGGDFKWHYVDNLQADSVFHTYTIHLTPQLIQDWGQSVYDSYMLTYLAPTIEMRNAGMTILIQDVELWNGEPQGPTPTPTPSPTPTPTPTATPTPTPSGSIQVWYDGTTYSTSTGLHNTDFADLWDSLHSTLTPSSSVHFSGSTDYVADRTIKLTKSGVTITGDYGATIRAYSSTQPTTYLINLSNADNVKITGMTFSGLGYTDQRDWKQSYTMVHIEYCDNLDFTNNRVEHCKQYLIGIFGSKNMDISYNYVRYGQNGISTGETGGIWNTGTIEHNEIRDCSQAAIKLRLALGMTIRYNDIHMEYTYWRDFYHNQNPGSDGLGVAGYSSTGGQGIYFGRNDAPSVNCDIYGNTITDGDNHIRSSKGVMDGDGVINSGYSTKSENNQVHGNTITGCYYGIYVPDLDEQSIVVYGNSINNVVKNQWG